MLTYQETVTLEKTTCANCGVTFSMPSHLIESKRESGGEFYCPNGHRLLFVKTTVDRLRERLEQTEKALRESKCETMAERQKREEVEKNHARLVLKGVCPCCRRNFKNVRNHMAHKHPDYVKKL